MTDPAPTRAAAATLAGLCAGRAAAEPAAVAAVGAGLRLSCGDLDRAANQLAHRLAGAGVTPGDVVALYSPRHPAGIAACLGILRAGAQFLGLDPAAPPARTAALLADAQPKVTLIHGATLPCPAPGTVLDLADPAAVTAPADPPAVTPDPGDPAVLLYPPPSPGAPVTPGAWPTLPGVTLDHAALTTLVTSPMPGDLLFHHADPAALATSAYDQATFLIDTLLPLARGVRVVVAEAADLADPARFAGLVEREHVTVVTGTPTDLAAVLAGPGEAAWLAAIRVLALRGRDFPDGFWTRLPAADALKVRLYGPPECAGVVTFSPVLDPAHVGLGYPLEHVQAYVVCADARLAAAGEPGELCVAGPLVGRGYRTPPAWAQEQFVDAEGSGDRLFRTGDLVRWQPDGQLELLGRVSGPPVTPVDVPGFAASPSEAKPGPDDTAVARFQAHRQAAPDHPAITDAAGVTVSYAQLDLGARRLAAALRSHGVTRGDRVGLLTGRGADFYCGLLGILYAGAAYVPLDPGDPPGRTTSLLDRAWPSAVVIDDWSLTDRTGALPVVCLVDPALGRQGAGAPETVAPADPAVCLFVDKEPFEVSHAGLVRSADAARDRLGVGPADQVLAYAAPATPPAVWEWATTLLNGATARTVAAATAASLPALRESLGGVTVATLPAGLAALARPEGLRVLVTTGPALAVDGPATVVAADDLPPAPALAWPRPDPATLRRQDIETTLAAQPGVDDAAVVSQPGPDGETTVAYAAHRGNLDPDRLLDELAGRLPPEACPDVIVPVAAIPRTAAGQPDLRALPGPDGQAGDLSPAEAAVQAAFAAALGLGAVSGDANFFALGGDAHDVLAVRTHLHDHGWAATAADILAYRTPQAIAGHIRRRGAQDAPQGDLAGPLDLTPSQSRCLAAGLPEPRHFGRAAALTGPTPFDPGSLREALAAVTAFHDGLRATLADGYQEIHPVEAATPAPLDVTVAAAATPEAAAQTSTALQARLDPDHGPLLAAHLWRLPDGDRLVVAAHRLAADTASFEILLRDLLTAYGLAAAGRPIDLGLKTASLRAWTQAVAAFTASPELGGELDLWLAQAAAAAAAQLPLPATGGSGRATLEIGLDADQTRRLLTESAFAYTTTVHDGIVAATAWAAHEVFGVPAVALDVEGAGRGGPDDSLDLSRTVGWLAHSYPLVVPTNGILSSALIATKEAIRAIPHDGLGYALLSRLPGTGLDGGFTANVRVRYEPDPAPADTRTGGITTADWPVGETMAAANRAIAPVCLTAAVRAGRLGLHLDYDTGRLDEATAWRFVVAVGDGLDGIIEHCAAQPTPLRTASDVGETDLDDATITVLNALAADPRDYE